MIRFPCRCGYVFLLDDDQAGNSLQCPRCGLLNDAPLLSEIHGIEEDGSYKVGTPPDRPAPALDMATVRQTKIIPPEDPDIGGIDLTLTPEEFAQIGVPEDTDAPPPRYDPETGELIRPVDIKPSDNPAHARPQNIPFAQPTLTYSAATIIRHAGLTSAVAVLCQPASILSLVVVVMAQLALGWVTLLMVAHGLFILVPALILGQLGLIAHFGNVIDEVGFEQHDELPRLFRDLRFYDDLWLPLSSLLGAIFLCYGPGLVCGLEVQCDPEVFFKIANLLLLIGWVLGLGFLLLSLANAGPGNIDWAEDLFYPLLVMAAGSAAIFIPAGICAGLKAPATVPTVIALVEAAVGTYLFPAVFLTLQTSGTWLNLAPRRLMRTIQLCGGHYFTPILCWLAAVGTFFIGLTIQACDEFGVSLPILGNAKFNVFFVDIPLMVIGLILMHLFSTQLAMLYREHCEAFPWLLQRHIPVHDRQRAAKVRAASRQLRAGNVPRR